MTADGLVEVHIRAIPVPLWQQSQQHSDELFREFMLIAAERRRTQVDHDVPERLSALIEELTAQYGGFSGDNEQMLADAAAAGQESLDLVYEMPAAVSGAAQHLGDLMDEADDYCRRGQHLLTLATPEPLVRFRRWFLDEFVRQIAGEAPTPWPDYVSA